jgi:hypothetical protein
LAEAKHKFFKEWSEGRLPKVVFALIQDPTPYYDSSYGVNSANAGPYGDALQKEFYPFLEEKFRAIGAPWARIIYGGSTGGWASLAQLLAHPDYFGGAWSCCPGALDFRAFQTIDIYNDTNAFYDIGPFNRIPKPLGRLESGKLLVTVEDYSRQQLVTGTRSRSGGEMDAYDATYGPVGPGGYPAQLWDPSTGAINRSVARHWRENYDLGFILRRDWKHIGSKLVGKIHVIVGTDDTYYLENGVRFVEEVLQSTKKPENSPFYAGSITYGADAPHCYSGVPNGVTIEQHFLPIFVAHILKFAPSGADVESWMPSTLKRHPPQ